MKNFCVMLALLLASLAAIARDVNLAGWATVILDKKQERLADFPPTLTSADSLTLRLDRALKEYRFEDVDGLLAEVYLSHADTTANARELLYKWLFLREDFRRVDSLTSARLSENPLDGVEWTARGELMYRLLDYDSALACFSHVPCLRYDEQEAMSLSEYWSSVAASRADKAIHGIGKVLQKRSRFQESLDTLSFLFTEYTLNPDVLLDVALALFQLGRTSEAIDVFEAILNWDERNEKAHYFLGNGFTRLNYTQLAEKYPREVADSNAIRALQPALDLYAQGKLDEARQAALTVAVAMSFPTGVEPWTLMASIDWVQGRMDDAAEGFWAALRRCPEYGRAHAGLAKALEGKRMRWSVHRAKADSLFDATLKPDVPRIEEYILNWNSLAPRHQKEVALSVAPWKKFLPVLVECGSHHYIKPLHELLSECPGLETIRDQRIDLDARLWDDVRGAGGFTTVTGIEDVERTIYFGHNTVLHELTHQVHGLFPPDDAQKITDAFHAARAREDSGVPTFMSLYQQASVWEYFAEGANAYYTPRRDDYDAREIVRERLVARDPRLVQLVEEYVTAPNLDACYAVGFVNAAYNELERQRVDSALAFAERARAREPHAESVLSTLSYISSLRDDDALAAMFADTMTALYPNKAESHTRAADARFCRDGNARACIGILERGLPKTDSTERKQVRKRLASYQLYLGEYADAAAEYRRALGEVRDDPYALWGLGCALAEADDAVADSAFREAIAKRSGVVELRLDYARFLIQSGKLDDANAQIAEAELLAPGDAQVQTLRAWHFLALGVPDYAKTLLQNAASDLPEYRLASVLLLKAERELGGALDPELAVMLNGMAETDVPAWVFVPRTSSYEIMSDWPHWQRKLLEEILAER